MSKYYAVKNGRIPGIYNTWEECKEQTHGFKGAVFKSFEDLESARKYIQDSDKNTEYMDIEFDGEFLFEDSIPLPLLSESLENNNVVVYVDGSINKEIGKVGYGYLIYYKDRVIPGYGFSDKEEYLPMANVSGEILSVLNAIDIIDELEDVNTIEIRYDYNGIKEWSTKSWSANNFLTATYASIMDIFLKTHNVVFKHIDGHTGEPGNEAVDLLAKIGCDIVRF